MAFGSNPLKADANSWVMRDKDGKLARIRVVDMTDSHIQRWINYFRRSFRTSGIQGTDAQLDVQIRARLITAPAIYREAQKRGISIAEPTVSTETPAPVPATLTDTERLGRFVTQVERRDRIFAQSVLRFANAIRFHQSVMQVQVEFSQAKETLYYLCVARVQEMSQVASRVWNAPVHVVVSLSMAPQPSAPSLQVMQPELSQVDDHGGVTRRINLDED